MYIGPMKRTRQHGFTIYELLITMLMIGIILSIGVPSMTSFTQNSRMSGTANDLHASFQLARSESARSKSNIMICASANSMDAEPACGGSFGDGWIIFIDVNDDQDRAAGGDENVLRAHPGASAGITIATNGGTNFFGYAPTGLGRADLGGVMVSQVRICDERGNTPAVAGDSAARLLVVTPIGRAVVLRDIDRINDAGGCP